MDSICNEENFTEARLSPHTATGPNAIYLSLCQPAATVRLHHRFGELGNQISGRKVCLISRFQWISVTPAFNFGFHRFGLGYQRSLQEMLFLCQRPFDRLGVCRVKSMDWDIEPGLHLTLPLSYVIWCPKNPPMHIERLQSRKAPCCNGLKCTSNSNTHLNHFFRVALTMTIPQLWNIGSGFSTSHHHVHCSQ